MAENISATDDWEMEIVLSRPIPSRVVRVERQAGILLLDGALRWTKSFFSKRFIVIHCEQGDSRRVSPDCEDSLGDCCWGTAAQGSGLACHRWLHGSPNTSKWLYSSGHFFTY